MHLFDSFLCVFSMVMRNRYFAMDIQIVFMCKILLIYIQEFHIYISKNNRKWRWLGNDKYKYMIKRRYIISDEGLL